MSVKIRTSMGGADTLMEVIDSGCFPSDSVVVGHLDGDGWWPTLDMRGFYKFTPEDLRHIASYIEGMAAYQKSIKQPCPICGEPYHLGPCPRP